MTSSLRLVYDRAIETLTDAGVPNPRVDAELLLGSVLEVSRGRIQALLVMDQRLDASQQRRVDVAIARRAAREPVQHITGMAPFRGLDLAVGPGVFVPRPETEIVAQYAIDALRHMASAEPIAVDLGCGSGAIGLALATEVPHATVWALERDDQARAWAERNVERIGATNIHVVAGDFAEALTELDGRVSLVASNPPYVPEDAIPIDPEVHLFDPADALYSGADGLDAIRALSTRAHGLLHPGGTVVIEHGEGQSAAVRGILTDAGFRTAATFPDLTGRDRVTTAVRARGGVR